jgi:anaerobic ribonucleoside-triphosphate reductase
MNETEIPKEMRTKCEIWTRVMGYHRPVSQFNKGKKSEYKDRVCFKEQITKKIS